MNSTRNNVRYLKVRFVRTSTAGVEVNSELYSYAQRRVILLIPSTVTAEAVGMEASKITAIQKDSKNFVLFI